MLGSDAKRAVLSDGMNRPPARVGEVRQERGTVREFEASHIRVAREAVRLGTRNLRSISATGTSWSNHSVARSQTELPV